MSLFDKIGDYWETVADTGAAAIGAVVDTAQAWQDLATADSWDERMQVDDDLRAALSARRDALLAEHQGTASAVMGAAAALETGYRYGVARPVSTALQTSGASLVAAGPVMLANLLDGRDEPGLKAAWQQSAKLSPGQASVVGMNRISGQGPQDYATAHTFGAQGENYDPWFSFMSGTQDAVLQWYADPTVVAGKAMGAARNAATGLKPGDLSKISRPASETQGLSRRQRRLQNKFQALKDVTRGKNEAELFQLDFIRNSQVGDTLAALIARANREVDDEVRDAKVTDILRVGHGDLRLIEELKARGDSLGDDIENLHRDLDFMKASGADDPLVVARKAEVEDEIKRRRIYRNELDKLLSVRHELGNQIGTPDAALDNIRLSRLRRDTLLTDGPGSSPVRVTRWLGGYRPAGWIKLKDSRHTVQNFERMLERVRTLDPQTRMDLLGRVIRASDIEGRRQAVEYGERTIFAHVAERMGESREVAEKLYAEFGKRRGHQLSRLQSRRYTGGHVTAEGPNGPEDVLADLHWDADDAVWDARPVLDTQLDDELPLLDVDHLYRVMSRHKGARSHFKRLDEFGELTTEALDMYSQVWKLGKLFRLGYMVRTTMDPQIRMMVVLGAMGYAATAGQATKNLLRNRLGKITVGDAEDIRERMAAAQRLDEIEQILAGPGPGRVRLYRGMAEPMDPARIPGEGTRFTTQRDYAEQYMGENGFMYEIDVPADRMPSTLFSDSLGTGALPHTMLPADEATRARLIRAPEGHEVEDLAAEAEALRARLAQPERMVRRRRAKDERVHLGYGEENRINVGPYSLRPAHGETPEEFERSMFEIDASESFRTMMTDSATQMRKRLRAASNYETKHAGQAGHKEALLHAINLQIRQSPLAQRIINGESDDQLRHWLLREQEGRDYVRKMRSVYRGDVDDMIGRTRATVDNALGESDELYLVARDRNLTEQDLTAALGNPENWPSINGGVVAETFGQSAIADTWDKILDKFYRLMSDLPETVMGRHPLYVQLYEGRYKQMVRNADPDLQGLISGEELAKMRTAAQNWARIEMKRTLFDISAKHNVAHTFRWLFPFFSAWEDVMVKYGRLVVEKPQTIPHAEMVWQAPEKAGITIDEDGNVVQGGQGLSDDQFVLLPSIPGVKKLTSIAGWRMSKASVNIVLQGDPWWLPGWGPLVGFSANELAKRKPDLAGELDKLGILPYGVRESSWDLATPAPGWFSHAATALNPDDEDYKQTFSYIYATETMRINTGERQPPKSEEAFLDEIADKTRNWYIARAFASGVMPVSVSPQGDKQFYLDEAHRYRENYYQQFSAWQAGGRVGKPPVDWEQRFYRDYPQFYEAAVSLSKSNTGVDATQQAWNASKKYRGLIARKPEYGWFVVGEEGLGEYSQAARAAQFDQRVAPGSTMRVREQKDPREAMNELQAEKGWMQYQQITKKLDSMLRARGLRSYRSAGAADLAAFRQQYVAWLGQQNPAWLNDYESAGSTKLPGFLRFAASVVDDRRFDQRGDMQAMRAYLAMRGRVQQILATRGDSTLSAESNADLAEFWSAYGQWLKNRYVTFDDTYDRMLENDDLSVRV